MNAMIPWTPDAIGKLTIVQFLCMSSKYPPDRNIIETAEEFAEISKQEEAEWRHH